MTPEKSRRKRDSNPGSSALEARPTRRYWNEEAEKSTNLFPNVKKTLEILIHIPQMYAKLVHGYACAYQESRVCMGVCWCARARVCVLILFILFNFISFYICMLRLS